MNEYMTVPLQYISYEKYLWELLGMLNHHDIHHEVIGSEASGRTGISYPLYRFNIHPQAPRKICIIAGIHGNEIAGPLSLLVLLNHISFSKLPKDFHYVVYPMVNPTGFDLRQRYDDDYRDLNAVFETTLTSENYLENQVVIWDAMKFQPFEACITLHEDSDLESFYMYGLGKENVPFYHEICQRAETHCPVWSSADIYGKYSDERGLILSSARDYAFDGYFYAKGYAPIAYTLETPGKREIEFRSAMMADLVIHSIKQIAQALPS